MSLGRVRAPREKVGVVLGGRNDDLVAGLEAETVRDEVERFRRVAREDDLRGRRVEECGDGVAGSSYGRSLNVTALA